MPPFFIDIANAAVHLAVVILIYSTIILVPGLIVSYMLRYYGAFLQSAALRITLAAAILLPILALLWPFERAGTLHVETVPTSTTLSRELSDTALPAIISFEQHAGENPIAFSSPSRGHENPHPAVSANHSAIATGNVYRIQPEKTYTVRKLFYCAFFLLWLTVSAVLLCKYCGAFISLYLLRKNAFTAKKAFTGACEEAARYLNVAPPALYQSPKIHSPLTAGLLQPYILLPLGGTEKNIDSPEVFLHETAHIKRHDFLWNQFRYCAIALFPFQPLFWLVSKRLEELSDYVCDEIVVAAMPSRKRYATILFSLSFAVPEPCYYTVLGNSLLSAPSLIRRRIKRVVEFRRDMRRPSAGMSYMASIAAASVLSVFGCLVGIETCIGNLPLVQAVTIAPAEARQSLAQTLSFPRGARQQSAEEENTATAVSAENAPESPLRKALSFIARHENTSQTHPAKSALPVATVQENPQAENTPDRFIANDMPHDTGPDMPAEDEVSFTAETVSDNWFNENREEADGTAENDSTSFVPGYASAGNHFDGIGHDIPVFNGKSIEMPHKTALSVSVEFDYENYNYDFENSEDRKKYATYYGLAKWKNEPAWSPDGLLIAFTDQSRIWTVSVDGGAPELIFENEYEGYPVGNIESLTFSPDGREITFKKDVYDTARGSTISIINNKAIFTNPFPNIESVDIETGEHRIIVENGYTCAWSPNGRYLAYLFYDDGTNPDNNERNGLPVLLDTKTGETRFLDVDMERRYGKPSFSPGGTHIVLPSRQGVEAIELFSYEINTGDSEQMTWYNENDGHGKYRNYPEVSPDGRWIMYTDFTWTKDSPGKRLFVYETPTGEMYPLFPDEETPHSFGKWSPDGSRICYLMETNDTNYIYICDFIPESFGVARSTGISDFLPAEFKLEQNYPNPFNMATTIDFSLPGEGPVSLDIFNYTGQLVRRLVTGDMPAGSHSVIWDGLDDNGSTVSSGVYISRLAAGGKSSTMKMTLIK